MSDLVVRYPIHDLNGNLLVSPGTTLTDEFMTSLIESNQDATYPEHQLLQHGTVRNDLFQFIAIPPYDAIFEGEEVMAELTNLLEEVTLISPLLQILDFFKQNDSYTYRHMLVVYALSLLLAKDIFPHLENHVKHIATSHFHDLGKLAIPLHILNKPTPLTVSERDQVMHHPITGYVLGSYYLRDHRDITAVAARDHHERLDGSGAPRGICLQNRLVEIVSVCDIYDALVSSRPYRAASYDNRTALEVISEIAEKNQISWSILQALVARNRKKKPHFTETHISNVKRGVPPSNNVYGMVTKED